MNSVYIEEDQKKEHARIYGQTVFSLKRKYFDRFRVNFEQGIVFECFIPMFFFYTFATFNLDWIPLENVIVAYLIIAFAYFRFVDLTDQAWPLWIAAAAYFLYDAVYSKKEGTWYRLINFSVTAFTMEAVPTFFRRQFCVAELFIFATVNSYYFTFCLDSVIYAGQRRFISGCNVTNAVIFSPWVFLNMSGAIAYLMGKIYRNVPGLPYDTFVMVSLLVSGVGGFVLTLVCLGQYGSVTVLGATVVDVVTKEVHVFVYLALMLALGLFVISAIESNYPDYQVRKMFHALAFALFAPPIANASIQPPKLMVLAFNCVSVAMLIVEALRFKKCWPAGLNQSLTRGMKHYSAGFERQSDTLITTPTYLLMGCAFPLAASFTLIGGGQLPTTWTLYSLSGVVFLGVGDSLASLMGRAYGKNKWRALSNKTQEGSSFCIFGTCAAYYVLSCFIDQYHLNLFLCYVFAAIPSAVIEGCTMQHDNLSCAMAYFAFVMMFTALFDQ